MIILRDYQLQSIRAVYYHLAQKKNNPCIVIPTGGGKTPIIAQICRDVVEKWDGRVVLVTHVKELLQQSYDSLERSAPDLIARVGIYSAGLGRRDTDHPIILAGIQSVCLNQRAYEFGKTNIILVDEAHRIPSGNHGQYRNFFKDVEVCNPDFRVIGLTATPYRTTSGMICHPDNILNEICYEIGIRELIDDGYLCPLKSKTAEREVDVSDIRVVMGEFDQKELGKRMNEEQNVDAACAELVDQTKESKKVLVFAAGVEHAESIAHQLRVRQNHAVAEIYGETTSLLREQNLSDFRMGAIKYLVNVNVLTVGFDAPDIDCVALLRPTKSPGLYYQMVGRGFRIHPDKNECLILDFGGNIRRHGPVDKVKTKSSTNEPYKNCENPDCQAECSPSAYKCSKCGTPFTRQCPKKNCEKYTPIDEPRCMHCGYVFQKVDREMATTEADASELKVLSEIIKEEHEVLSVTFHVHTKRGGTEDDPKTLRVDYYTENRETISEWVCFEHQGYARNKAELWWQARSAEPVPDTAEEACHFASYGALMETLNIRTSFETGGKFYKILGAKLDGIKPPLQEIEPGADVEEALTTPAPGRDYDREPLPF